MRNRYGVLMVLFDLPMETPEDRRAYNTLRGTLRRNSYIYFHDSVYVKLLRNISSLGAELEKLKREAPERGSLRALPMSISAFQRLEIIAGERFDMALFADDMVVIGDETDETKEDDGLDG